MPSIEDLLTGAERKGTLNLMRWRALEWLLCISHKQRMQLQFVDADFRVSSAVVMIMVQVIDSTFIFTFSRFRMRVSSYRLYAFIQLNILTKKAADGILITEIETRRNRTTDAAMPVRLDLYHMNAVHVYKNVYRQVKKVFELAGLADFISVSDSILGA